MRPDAFLAAVNAALVPADEAAVGALVGELRRVRDGGGRLYVLGVGGSASLAAHLVIDVRKGKGVDAYAPSDSMPELSARTNDEGWDTVFSGWLDVSRLSERDALFVFSVGGGDQVAGTSLNIVRAIDLAKERGARVLGCVAKATGDTATRGDGVIVLAPPAGAMAGPVALAAMGVVAKMILVHDGWSD